MTSFETCVQKAIIQSIKKTIKGYIEEFSSTLEIELNSGKKRDWNTDYFIVLWNKIATNNPKKNEKEADPSVPQCEHMYRKGDKKDKRCTEKVSEKSETKSFCSRHYKKEIAKDAKKPDEKNDKFCCYVLTKGKNKDDECGAKISDKCDKGKYCSKHRNTDDKKEKPKKKASGKDEPIRAYRIKDGDLKGFHAFEKGGKKYVIEAETRTIKGCDVNGKLDDLDEDDIKMVRNIHPFVLDKKYESLSKNLSDEAEDVEIEKSDIDDEEIDDE